MKKQDELISWGIKPRKVKESNVLSFIDIQYFQLFISSKIEYFIYDLSEWLLIYFLEDLYFTYKSNNFDKESLLPNRNACTFRIFND